MRIIIILISFSTFIFSAAFNATDSLINIPISQQFKSNEVKFGVSGAYIGTPALENNIKNRYDLDFKFVYSINNQNQIALNLVNPKKIVGHYQFNLNNRFNIQQLSVGVRNITNDKFSTWDNSQFAEETNMSPYIVNTFYIQKMTLSIGYGTRAFQHNQEPTSEFSKILKNLNGVFFGITYNHDIITLMSEYDGKDLNFGLKISVFDKYDFNIGLTEQLIENDINSQYENAPKRSVTFGISSKNFFSFHNHYNKEIFKLNEKLIHYEKKELKRKQRQKEKFEKQLINTNDILKSKVVSLYSESLTKYNSKKYNKSIKLLHEALKLDPTNMQILMRLGSVYYTFGLLDYASYYWKKAIQINPNYPDLKSVQAFLKAYP